MPADLASLNLHDAVRVFFDQVSYRNPLPLWNTSLRSETDRVVRHLQKKFESYLNSSSAPSKPLRLVVPHKPEVRRPWLIPSNTDQLLLQACTSSFAAPLCEELDEAGNVYSFRYELGEDGKPRFSDPLEAWIEFQDETLHRAARSRFILQLDLQDAFPSIDRESFIEFLRPRGNESGTSLLRLLLDGWDPSRRGIPLVNDSLFFLGNCYLARVDAIVSRYTDDFIRFVDDYRIFGDSDEALERIHERISTDLEGTEFSLNAAKTRLGTGEDFQAVTRSLEKASAAGEYYGTRTFLNSISPSQLVTLIGAALRKPERYLTVRFGRLISAEIRRMRDQVYGGQLFREYQSLLEEDPEINGLASDLMDRYSLVEGEEWRLVWLLYLSLDLEMSSILARKIGRLKESGGPLTAPWANRVLDKCRLMTQVDSLDLSYVEEAGRSCEGVT